VIPVTATPVFASAAEAADLARAGLRYLAAADPAQLTAAERAEAVVFDEKIVRPAAEDLAATRRVLKLYPTGDRAYDFAAAGLCFGELRAPPEPTLDSLALTWSGTV
jgi:hypothetical protein